MSECEVDQTHLVPRLMMTEDTSPLRYMPSWRPRRHSYL